MAESTPRGTTDTSFEPGRSKTGGRKKGTPNKRTQAKLVALQGSLTPLQFFERMMAGEPFKLPDGSTYMPTIDDMRWGAMNAAPYRHPKLSAVRVSDATGLTHEQWIRRIGADLEAPARHPEGEEPWERHPDNRRAQDPGTVH